MDISKITDYLFLGTQPKGSDYDILRELRIGLIINMCVESPPNPDNGNPPIETLWLKTYDRFWRPIPLRALREGINRSLPIIREGGRVFAHCHAGVHRSAAMGSCILIAKEGYTAENAAELIKAHRETAKPDTRHIWQRIKKFEESYWNRSIIKTKG